MIPEILNSYQLNLAHLRRLVADLSDEQMVAQTSVVVNHPAWTIGHLVHSSEAMAGELGVAPWLPSDWRERFGTGSRPWADAAASPSKEDLLGAMDDAYNRLYAALSSLGEEGMAQPLPDEDYRRSLPTIGHALLHIFASHTALHIGQLTVWRRAMGLPRVPEPFDQQGDSL